MFKELLYYVFAALGALLYVGTAGVVVLLAFYLIFNVEFTWAAWGGCCLLVGIFGDSWINGDD